MLFLSAVLLISLIHLFVASLHEKCSSGYVIGRCGGFFVLMWLVLLVPVTEKARSLILPGHERDLAEWFLFAAGLLGANAFFDFALVYLKKSPSLKKKLSMPEKAILVTGIIASVYIVYAITDSWLYFRGDPINFRISQSHNVLDTSCDRVIFFKKEAEDGAYRCPKSYDIPTKIMLGNIIHSFPLLPWPDYIEGHSHQLTNKAYKIKLKIMDSSKQTGNQI